jgi:hypothetical protein
MARFGRRWRSADSGYGHLSFPAVEVHKAWQAGFGSLAWEYLVTLTFDPNKAFPVGEDKAERETLWWCGFLSHICRAPIGWISAAERGRSGQWHSHVLLIGVTSSYNLSTALRVWRVRNGMCNRRNVHNVGGAVLYTTKEAYATGNIQVSETISRYRVQARKDNRSARSAVLLIRPSELRNAIPAGGNSSGGLS